MVYIDPQQATRKEMYKILSGSVIPRPIAFITTKSKAGVLNAAPFSFFNVASAHPPLLSVSIGRRNGEVSKDTAKNIFETKEFVIHIVDPSFVHDMNITAGEYTSDINELELTSLTTVPSKKISVAAIKEAKIRFECELFQSIPLGEEEEMTQDLIIGKVVMAYFEDEIYEDGKIIADKLQPVGRLAGSDYVELGTKFSIPRPKI
jgi:flavin reductase (DIM6/NTAB) family NADH-FMN oxidoreductase RutF